MLTVSVSCFGIFVGGKRSQASVARRFIERGMRIALGAGELYGRLVAAGVVAWLAFQTFENIGMNLGIMPVTGVPLPFVSYGGTSMFANWIAIAFKLLIANRFYRPLSR